MLDTYLVFCVICGEAEDNLEEEYEGEEGRVEAGHAGGLPTSHPARREQIEFYSTVKSVNQ